MVDVWLPYGKTEVCARIPTRNYSGSIEPKKEPGVANPRDEIERALRDPLGTKQLKEIAKSGDRVAVVVDDATRTPSRIMILPILEELRRAGVKERDVKIIFACGAHRAVEPEEMRKLVGESTIDKVNVLSHDCRSEEQVYLGKTRFGTKVYVNKSFTEADVRILTGDIGLHYCAGYGGGRKSLLPGITSLETLQSNHAMLLHPKARMGVLDGNPVHEDMMDGAKLAGAEFSLNIVTNAGRELVRAFAGDSEQVFYEGVKLVDEMYKVPIEGKADIVVVSPGGHPFDINLYQACKGIIGALEAVKRGGVIVLVAECPEGHGNDVFYDWMTKFEDLKQMEREIKRRFVIGGHKAYHLTKALQKAKIILVSVIPDYQALNVFRLKTMRATNDAMHQAFDIAGKNAKVLAMPHGNITLPVVKVRE